MIFFKLFLEKRYKKWSNILLDYLLFIILLKITKNSHKTIKQIYVLKSFESKELGSKYGFVN